MEQPHPLCRLCHREVGALDMAFTRKLINRGATEYLCVDCLAAHFGIQRDELLKKAEEFKAQGCTLFP